MDYSEDEDMYGNMDMDDSEDDSEDEDDEDDADDLIVSRGARKLALEQFVGNEDEDEDSEEDPDFTGEDDEDEDDDLENSDEDMEGQNNGDEVDDEDDDDDEGDDDDEEEDEEEEDEEEPVPVASKPVKKEAEVKKEVKKAEVKKEVKKEESKKANIKTLPNGLIIEDVKVGEGARAKSGKKIGMRYIGRLTNGKVFDKNTNGKPFSFNLGRGEVIKGWDLGIQGMQLGGERKLTIPSALA